MYVTQDVMPFNDDYDMQQLARYNDYLFLMAYDEHNTTSAPGDVASQHWMEKATDWAAKNIPNDKLVLGLAGYGYDCCRRRLQHGVVRPSHCQRLWCQRYNII